MNHLYAVILAGGSGERLWPLSRRNHPKQLIPFLQGKSLLEQTIERVGPLVENKEHLVVVTNQDQRSLISEAVGDLVGVIIAEPAARNTGPAILLTAEKIMQQDPEAVLLVLPSDAFIPDYKAFCASIKPALVYVSQHQQIATFGLKPTTPATGYGYIQAGDVDVTGGGGGFAAIKFHEKPDLERAKRYQQQGDMFWNIGIFAAQAKMFVQEFNVYASDVATAVKKFVAGEGAYQAAPSISIDYAVMEKSLNVVVFPVAFEWNDVGNIRVFLELLARYSTKESGATTLISLGGDNNLASTSKKIVACIGVSDLCVVETEDVLLIVQKDKAEEVKKVLAQVKVTHQASV